jgi:hypothetical protein
MSHAYFITSSVELDSSKPFKGTSTRTVFSTEERINQTVRTLKTCYDLDPNAYFFLIDSSQRYFDELNVIPNLNYIQLENLNSVVANTVRTYSNKSYCECLMILEFLKHFKKELKKFDFITKICGRYFFDHSFDIDIYNSKNINKFFFKNTMTWSGPQIDFLTDEQLPKDMLVNGELTGTYTVAHGMHKDKLDQYEALMFACAQSSTEHAKFYYQDVEYALYYFMRMFNLLEDVVTVPWDVHGQSGVTGVWVKY